MRFQKAKSDTFGARKQEHRKGGVASKSISTEPGIAHSFAPAWIKQCRYMYQLN